MPVDSESAGGTGQENGALDRKTTLVAEETDQGADQAGLDDQSLLLHAACPLVLQVGNLHGAFPSQKSTLRAETAWNTCALCPGVLATQETMLMAEVLDEGADQSSQY